MVWMAGFSRQCMSLPSLFLLTLLPAAGESASSASLAPGRTVLVDGAPGLFAAPALASAVSAAALINSGSSSSGSSGGVTGGAYISGLSGGTPAHLSGGQQLQPAGGTAVGAGRTTAGAAGSGATAPWGPEKTGLPPHYHPLGGAAGSHGVDPTIAAGEAGYWRMVCSSLLFKGAS